MNILRKLGENNIFYLGVLLIPTLLAVVIFALAGSALNEMEDRMWSAIYERDTAEGAMPREVFAQLGAIGGSIKFYPQRRIPSGSKITASCSDYYDQELIVPSTLRIYPSEGGSKVLNGLVHEVDVDYEVGGVSLNLNTKEGVWKALVPYNCSVIFE